MPFHRSYSKVWWGNQLDQKYYNYQGSSCPSSLEYSTFYKEGDLVSKSSVEHDENQENQRSLDSGFSDNEEISNFQRKKSSKKETGTPAEFSKFIDKFSLLANNEPEWEGLTSFSTPTSSPTKFNRNLRNIIKETEKLKTTSALFGSKDSINSHEAGTPYKSENNLTEEHRLYLLNCDIKSMDSYDETIIRNPQYFASNIRPLCVQRWLDELKTSYSNEIMCTLQTKSITHEALRNVKITSAIVAKLVREIQMKAIILQNEFDSLENAISEKHNSIPYLTVLDLVKNVGEFAKFLKRQFTPFKGEFKVLIDGITNILLMTKDLYISLEKNHYLDKNALDEDIGALKRCSLKTLQLIYREFIGFILRNATNTKCSLILRANLNMIINLSSFDHVEFTSLNDAFLKNDAVRSLLILCLNSKSSSMRALILRALATISSDRELVKQFDLDDGIEIIKDILSNSSESLDIKRSDLERREAVSLLVQITAPWHGNDHKVNGLKESSENIVETLTDIIEKTNCCQTLLLCAACLNNLSRLEMTSIYSIISNESILKLKNSIERNSQGISIFIYEQVVNILLSMSNNKKCYNHLYNKNIIDFLTNILQSQHDISYITWAENVSQHRTVKIIVHILKKLMQDSKRMM